jgi:hypothetical protein
VTSFLSATSFSRLDGDLLPNQLRQSLVPTIDVGALPAEILSYSRESCFAELTLDCLDRRDLRDAGVTMILMDVHGRHFACG